MPRQNHSWLALITFCATTALVAALGLAILIASATVAYAIAQSLKLPSSHTNQPAAPLAEQSFSGVVTDSHCGARHAKNSGKSPAECARACVRNGLQYTLVDGDKVYVLQGQGADLDRLAGQRTTIGGTLSGNTIQVNSIVTQ
ncbi:MAG TPA: hypothetical protein VGU64_08440 [Terriglobales bacterium]|nr:hypothetical protein [Terriglobales bacterium]